MIQKESWHLEVASFDKQREFLYQQYMRGDIGAEEFAKEMLRFWRSEKGKGSLLEERDGQLYMTADWIYAHKPWIDRAREVGDKWMEVYQQADHLGRRLGVSTDLHSYRFISSIVTGSKFSVAQVRSAQDIFGTPLESGARVEDSYVRGRRDEDTSWRTGEDFDRWYLQTLKNSEEIVEMYREYLERVNLELEEQP